MDLIDHGTKNQKLTASFYNQTLFDENIKIQAARKVMLEYHQDLELVAAFFPAYASKTYGWIRNLFYRDDTSIYSEEKPRQPVLSNYFESRDLRKLSGRWHLSRIFWKTKKRLLRQQNF